MGKSEGKKRLGDPGVDGMIILRSIFRNLDVGTLYGSGWLRIGRGGDLLQMWGIS